MSHVTASTAEVLETLPGWATLVRAPNPGPMTLDGTNTWVLRPPGISGAACVVVDPGPLHEGHLRAVADHGPVAAILLTHGHPDHTEGAARLGELTGAPVLGPQGVGPPLPATLDVDGLLVETVATPGHTADSVSFLVSYQKNHAVLTGDTILGRGTTIVAWPDGDLGDYLASLRRLAELDAHPALPGHGPALVDCAAAARYYLRHREARLDQVRTALEQGATEAADVVARVYADVDRALWPAAEWSVRAQLAYLRRESHPPAPGLDVP